MKVDARGQLCPQPVILTKKALDENAGPIEVIVDNAVAKENVTRFLKSKAMDVECVEEGTNYILKAHPTGEEPQETHDLSLASGGAMLIAHDKLGGDDAELGKALMKTLIGTLPQLSNGPQVLCLMNEGVKLAVKGEATAEGLEEFIARGGKVLVCGICLKHFNLEGQTVGTVSNMFEIFEQLTNHNSLVL